MIDELLESLVASGTIASYDYDEVNEDGVVGEESDFRNTERLVLQFNDGKRLIIDTLCSGCAENTTLVFSYED
jgi:hypothetical protein